MDQLNIPIQSKKLLLGSITVFTINFITLNIIGAVNFLVILPNDKSFATSKIEGLLVGINFFTVQNNALLFLMTLYLVQSRLSKINEYLKQQHHSQGEQVTSLRTVAKFLDRICDTVESIRYCQTVNAIIYLGQFCFYTILLFYGYTCKIFQPSARINETHFVLISTIMEIYQGSLVIFIFWLAHCIRRESKISEILIQQLSYGREQDVRDLRAAQIVLLQLTHRAPSISCGLFVVDWKLLLGMFALCFSYLIIIVQFEFM
jgi:7tm Chemosensory receptor